jgi:DNA polymerase III epsilon subunit-like protein
MSNIIKFPSLKNLRSMVTMPLRWVAVDLEYVRDELNRKFCVCEIAFWDIESNKEIFRTYIRPEENFLLSRRLQQKGITEDDLRSAPTMGQIDQLLRSFLPSFMLIFWNAQNDLKHYPTLKSYSYGTRCCMKRYADRYGAYNVDWGDHSFLKLEDAADEVGFKLEPGEFYHQALTDAKACAFIWNELNKESLPASISLDLVLRDDVYDLLEAEKKTLVLEDKTSDGNENPLPF